MTSILGEQNSVSRRQILTGILGITGALATVPFFPETALAVDLYGSNTELYGQRHLLKDVHYQWRYMSNIAKGNARKTAIIAPHGGAIEPGTSELCLAIAGFVPASREPISDVPHRNYWMFEAISKDANVKNSTLHVTSANCDDKNALKVAGNALNVVALHGCTGKSMGRTSSYEGVLVGGKSAKFRKIVVDELKRVGFNAVNAHPDFPKLSGTDSKNIANRTLRPNNLATGGVQLEITTALRAGMFETNTIADRKNTRNAKFHHFVKAVRAAIVRMEQGQVYP